MMRKFMLLLIAASPLGAQPFPPDGRMVDLGGYRVHLNCAGEGTPTVMIAGAGFSFDWALVQPEVAEFTRVCTWDPAGTAWSDRGPGVSCRARAGQLHSLLTAEGPVVMVGMSYGALVARYYASEYKGEVAGMVMVDHAFLNPGEGAVNRPLTGTPGLDSPPVLIHQEPIVLGMEDISQFAKLPAKSQALHRWATELHPAPAIEEAAEACTPLVEGKSLGSMPLVVVSTGNPSSNYLKLQTMLLALSSDSKQLMATRSIHVVQVDQPEVVVEAIREVTEAVKNHTRLSKK